MKLAGVIGYPIGHSLSPRLHAFWLRELAIDGAYVPLAAQPERFSEVVVALQEAGFAGLNVTVPHKQAALAMAHSADEAATRSGAANLLILRENTIEARNTDVEGLKGSIEEDLNIGDLDGQPVIVRGAGGAARAAVLALDELRAGEIRVINRDLQRAAMLADKLQSAMAARIIPLSWHQWPQAARGATLLVNATSAGMLNSAPLELDLGRLPSNAAVYDLVYNPLETQLLKQARASGHKAVNGLGMLMRQAAPAFELFYGKTPQVSAALRATLEQALAT